MENVFNTVKGFLGGLGSLMMAVLPLTISGGFDAFDERVSLANSYIVGYAKDLITDEECNDMIDLALNKISIVNGEGIIWDNTFDEENEMKIWILKLNVHYNKIMSGLMNQKISLEKRDPVRIFTG